MLRSRPRRVCHLAHFTNLCEHGRVPTGSAAPGNWAFGGRNMPMGGDQVRRSPAHAGRLRPWERFTIALVVVLMGAIIALALL